MSNLTEITPSVQQLNDLFEENRDRFGCLDSKTRSNALEIFQKDGFPGRKDEEYKFTHVDAFVRRNLDVFQRNEKTKPRHSEIKGHLYPQEGHHLVFVNGNFVEDLSDIQDDEAISMEGTIHDRSVNQVAEVKADPFVALNTAWLETGVQITVKKGQKAMPVFIYHYVDGNGTNFGNSRIIIESENSSESTFLEKTIVVSDNAFLLNKVTEVQVARNSSVNYTILQDNPDQLLEINGLKVRQERDSRFYANTYAFKGKLIRNNLNIQLDGENCESHMHGLYLLSGQSHVDNHTSVDHRKPNSYSNELYKGIVDEKAHAVFNGKIYVRPDAQQTNAFQSNNNISMSDDAVINTKPQLEIWADDVKCSHGCTVGQLDEEAVFYLRSRGLSKTAARGMLLIAFAEESFEYLPFEYIREELHTKINQRLGT